MKLVTAILAKHEAAPDRYLARVVERCRTFSDAVLLLDDRSTDGTAKLASSLGCQVRTRSVLHEPAWARKPPLGSNSGTGASRSPVTSTLPTPGS